MSHTMALAVIPGEGDVQTLVAEAMEPHRLKDDFTGVWGWWTVGGRFTGWLDGYLPQEDPTNWITCDLCKGSGYRDDATAREIRQKHPGFGCNGCDDNGTRLLHPSELDGHPGDVQLAEVLPKLSDAQIPLAVFTHGAEGPPIVNEVWADGQWVERNNKQQIRAKMAVIIAARARAGLSSRLVVVDYHN